MTRWLQSGNYRRSIRGGRGSKAHLNKYSFGGSLLSKANKKTIDKFENKNYPNTTEWVQIVLGNGVALDPIKGDFETTFVNVTRKWNGGTVSHNHPESKIKGMKEHTVFSGADIDIFARGKLNEIRMVYNDNGKQVLLRLQKGTATEKQVNAFKRLVLKRETFVIDSVSKMDNDPKMKLKKYIKNVNKLVREYDSFFSENAVKYGLSYTKE